MFEALILGVVQGVFEWLPVSSEGVIVLIETQIFGSTLTEAVRFALFLHLGTVLAAIVYLRKDIVALSVSSFRSLFEGRSLEGPARFIFIGTLASGVLGLGFMWILEEAEAAVMQNFRLINLLIGLLLLVTAYTQFSKKKTGARVFSSLGSKDGFMVGIAQGFAALPGVSRSGTTVAALVALGFKESEALKASFLLGIPIVIIANILLNVNEMHFSLEAILSLATSFVFGLLTIHSLLIFAKRVHFGWFILFFALLVIGASFLPVAVNV